MNGFDILINFNLNIENSALDVVKHTSERDVVGDFLKYNEICVKNNMICKFEKDKLFFQSDKYICVLDGVIVNRASLLQQYGMVESWDSCFVTMYETLGERFFEKMEGSFSGALYDKSKDKLILFSDQIGSKYLYYALIGDKFICSSTMANIYEYFQKEGIQYSLDIDGAFMLLSYGYMLEDYTLCDKIRKIKPGCYITYVNNNVESYRYYTITGLPNNALGSEKDIIEKIDYLFTTAIDKQFKKDKEYGYKHVANLSGGLDSRMTVMVADELGYKDQLNLTFSQTGYYDASIPEKIASDLGHEWLFKSLDGGNWLLDVDECVRNTGGLCSYIGIAHGNSLQKYMSYANIGLSHSGMLGDVVLADSYYRNSFVIGDGANSRKYIKEIKSEIKFEYSTPEMSLLYNRGFNGINCSVQSAYNDFECLSPFCDLKLMEYAFSIPIEYRRNHKLYFKWIINKHPKAANYPWAQIEGKITNPLNFLNFKGIPLRRIPSRIIKKLTNQTTRNFSMNPIAYYLDTNSDLRSKLVEYFDYASAIDDERLKKTIIDIKQGGSVYEMVQAITLMSAIKQFFIV